MDIKFDARIVEIRLNLGRCSAVMGEPYSNSMEKELFHIGDPETPFCPDWLESNILGNEPVSV